MRRVSVGVVAAPVAAASVGVDAQAEIRHASPDSVTWVTEFRQCRSLRRAEMDDVAFELGGERRRIPERLDPVGVARHLPMSDEGAP